ncbi:MAG: hypothetical protein HY284_07825 [Nitrospirae bacterium]|nr:hypothetical protein [Nitrospirota bacterium]
MFSKTFSMMTVSLLLIGCATYGDGIAGEAKKGPAAEALQNVGPTLAKTYTFEPFHPAMPDHLWMDAGNGRGVFLHFNKPVTDPKAMVIFVGEGVKSRFCAEDQPDGGKTGFVHFHRSHTPEGETGMAAHGHGGKSAEEGYWLKHVAVGEFDMMGMRFAPGTAMNFMPTPAPKCSS